MIPGVGFFYSGLLRRKNALSMIYLSMMCVAVVSFEVWLPLYMPSFSTDAYHCSGFSGDSLWHSVRLATLLSVT